MKWSTRILISSSLTLVTAMMVTACGSNKDDNKGAAAKPGARGTSAPDSTGNGGNGKVNANVVIEMKKSHSTNVKFGDETIKIEIAKLNVASKDEADKTKSFIASVNLKLASDKAEDGKNQESLDIVTLPLNKENKYTYGSNMPSATFKGVNIGYNAVCSNEKCEQLTLRLQIGQIVEDEKSKKAVIVHKDLTLSVKKNGESEISKETDRSEEANKELSALAEKIKKQQNCAMDPDMTKPETDANKSEKKCSDSTEERAGAPTIN
jgi:hypothetical protein